MRVAVARESIAHWLRRSVSTIAAQKTGPRQDLDGFLPALHLLRVLAGDSCSDESGLARIAKAYEATPPRMEDLSGWADSLRAFMAARGDSCKRFFNEGARDVLYARWSVVKQPRRSIMVMPRSPWGDAALHALGTLHSPLESFVLDPQSDLSGEWILPPQFLSSLADAPLTRTTIARAKAAGRTFRWPADGHTPTLAGLLEALSIRDPQRPCH